MLSPYGYKRINGDKQTLVVDEPAAEIVRKVFRLACQGMGVTAIAEQLTEEKVLIPSAYTAKYFPGKLQKTGASATLTVGTQIRLVIFWTGRNISVIPCWANPSVRTSRQSNAEPQRRKN